MDRRRFLGGLASVLVAPLVAEAQPAERVYRIGVLSPFSPSATALWHQALRQGLRDLGWIEGKNISFEYRYSDEREGRLRELAAELVRLKVDVIVVAVNTDALAAKNATRDIPIVVASAGDPVSGGLVKSLAHPGGNLTGLSQIAPEMAGKRLALLKEVVPGLSRVAVLWNAAGTTSPISWKESQAPARELGLQLQSLTVPVALDISSERIRGCWRSRRVRAGPLCHVSAGRPLCRQDPQGRETGRPPHRATHEVRVGHQSQNRQGARPHHPAVAAGAGRPGDRMIERPERGEAGGHSRRAADKVRVEVIE
jgi:hypothetical protein